MSPIYPDISRYIPDIFISLVGRYRKISDINSIGVDTEKVQAILNWPVPRRTTQVRSFHGLASFYRRFIHNFSIVTAPLTTLMGDGPFQWTPEADEAFSQVKKLITEAPVLALPDFSELFEVTTDACKTGIGAVLSQKGKPVAFYSQKLAGGQVNYSTYDVELYSVVQALKHWRHYLVHREFLIKTDHEALKFINTPSVPIC